MIRALIAAAGSGTRTGLAYNKLLYPLEGKTVLEKTVEVFLNHPEIGEVTVVCTAQDEPVIREMLGQQVRLVRGGASRGESVRNGLRAMPEDTEYVLIHDGARPFVTPGLLSACIRDAKRFGSAVAAVAVTDTVQEAHDGYITATPKRDSMFAAQTPQTFVFREIRAAYERSGALEYTDDAAVARAAGLSVHLTPGEACNRKITTREDLLSHHTYTGIGYDVHRLCSGRELWLGGVRIPFDKGLEGHSDADVLLHAVMDALLGAAGEGDIGRHFPDSEEAYRGISSMLLLEKVMCLLQKKQLRVTGISAVVVAQQPKLAPFVERMQANLRAATGALRVNVAATTTERLGFEGRGEGISATATVTVEEGE